MIQEPVINILEAYEGIDEEYETQQTGCPFYKGVYFGDLDKEHLLKLATILANRCLNKETESE